MITFDQAMETVEIFRAAQRHGVRADQAARIRSHYDARTTPAVEDFSRSDPLKLRRTATHECGHAIVIAALWGSHYVTGICIRPDHSGECDHIEDPVDDPKGRLIAWAAGSAAVGLNGVAVARMLGRRYQHDTHNYAGDLEHARAALGDDYVDRNWSWAEDQADKILCRNARVADSMIEALLRDKAIEGAELQAWLREVW